MATYLKGVTAGEAFSKRFQSCWISATNTVSMADAGGDLVKIIGVCQNKPASGEAADVVIQGECLAQISNDAGEISAGDHLIGDIADSGATTVALLTKTTGADDEVVVAVALEGSNVDLDIIRVLITGPNKQG